MEVKVFETVTGRPVAGGNVVPYTNATWAEGWNTKGSISFEVPDTRRARAFGPYEKLVPWKHSVAIIGANGEPRVAGPITARSRPTGNLKVTAADAWALWEKRLVMSYLLNSRWIDGEVVIDEENPPQEWVLQFAGYSLAGIGAKLIQETLKWGQLLVDSPAATAGTNVRTYNAWDMAKVSDRLKNLGEVINGPLMRFEPYIRSDGYLRIRYVTGEGLRGAFQWSQEAPGQRIQTGTFDEDGGSLATQSYGLGGREDDIVLVARSRSNKLTQQGYPVMQMANTGHSTVGRLDTLMQHVQQDVEDGSTVPETFDLQVSESWGTVVGDWVDFTVIDEMVGSRVYRGRVTNVSGGSSSEWQKVSLVPREGGLS